MMVCRNGQNGQKGEKGEKGDRGENGENGTLSLAYVLTTGNVGSTNPIPHLQAQNISFAGTGIGITPLFKNVSSEDNIFFKFDDTGIYTINFVCMFCDVPSNDTTSIVTSLYEPSTNTDYFSREERISGPFFQYIFSNAISINTTPFTACIKIQNLQPSNSLKYSFPSLQIIKIDNI